jgi:hypothetical protein
MAKPVGDQKDCSRIPTKDSSFYVSEHLSAGSARCRLPKSFLVFALVAPKLISRSLAISTIHR